MVDQLKKEVEQSKPGIIQRHQGSSGTVLASIPENSNAGSGDDEDVYAAMKKKQAVAAKQGTAAATTATYQYNQKAHRKFQSQKSLVERILKSHSEGNRFIRNEDL